MYYISYEKQNKAEWGIADPDKNVIYPAYFLFDEICPETLLRFIQDRDLYGEIIINDDAKENAINMEDVSILAPIVEPVRNILCVGKNYLDHIKEFDKRKEVDDIVYPSFFTKATTSINGPYDYIPLHGEVTSELDYEVELAIIIGRKGVNITEEESMDYVFGYTILNDVTARDIQKNHLQWFKGKSLDGFCPLGPWIADRNEIDNPMNLNIESRVNGEIRQSSNTSNMIFSISTIISILSQGMTLLPGDIIATGTPSGVGMGFEPPKLLKEGDIVEVEIEKICKMINRISS